MNEFRGNDEPEKKARRHEAQGKKRGSMKFPDRWLDYTPTGRVMDEVRIVAFKTPLKDEFYHNNGKKENYRFDIKTFLRMMEEAGTCVGLVINLTFTERYYCKSEWEASGITYQKIPCPGHTIDEREDLVEIFKTVVREFFAQNEDNDKVVAVHCTHGLNRTGYMICRYMIDELHYSANDAIECMVSHKAFELFHQDHRYLNPPLIVFDQCRGHVMERYRSSLEAAEQKRTEPLTLPHEQQNGTSVVTEAITQIKESTKPTECADPRPPTENLPGPAVENKLSQEYNTQETVETDQNGPEVKVADGECSATTIIHEESESVQRTLETPAIGSTAPSANAEEGNLETVPSVEKAAA